MYSTSPYTSPPPPPIVDPYRASPIPVPPNQPYAFSPPPMPPVVQAQPGYMRPSQPGYPVYAQSSRSGGSSRYANGGGGYQNGVPPRPSGLPPAKHKGTLAPGQMVQVGDQSVRIEKYLSEGGYAHVYLTTSDKPIYPPVRGDTEKSRGRWGEKGYTQHCLKRIAFEDESVWADVRKEIEVMKALPPNPHLTQYLGSAHTKLPRGGYEVYILMEFCSGGGIIDLLNKRLRDRLKEIEILNIFTDVCEAVAAMHALKRPLLHRDLKIENVLSSPSGQPPTPQRPTPLTFKLCDFGSTTYPATSPPSTKLESDTLALDLNKNTTLQYRSPEMVEPMLGLAVGLPSDVWALGVLLYKLCYYTTPFEEHGTLAIVNAKYTFPQYPVYSPRLQHLIASMLMEQPVRRPTVFEVLLQAHEMSGTRPEIDYPVPSRSFPPSTVQQSNTQARKSSNLLDFTSPTSPVSSAPIMQPSLASTVQPQRRGRPMPGRGSSQGNVQPPMPVPSAFSQSPQQQQQRPQPQPAKLQTTGEKPSSPKMMGSVDAFGMPSIAPPQKASSGFSDAFGGSIQSDGKRAKPTPGFSDSFGASVRAGSSPEKTAFSQVPRPSASTQNSFSSFNLPRTTSPQVTMAVRKSPDPASSIPEGEVSFETRFPSIETLSSSDTFSPPLHPGASRSTSNQPDLISPITSPPPLNSRPSVMGNLTGGDIASNHLSAPGRDGPQPRSTHVTGTAFRFTQGGLLSPDSATTPSTVPTSSASLGRNHRDYFEGVEAKPLVSPSASNLAVTPGAPIDLMTGDGESMSGQLLPSRSASSSGDRPALSRSASSVGSAKAPPATGHNRQLLPSIDAKKPTSNIDSESWSPLERLKQSQQEDPAKMSSARGSSSSDEEGPEDASGTSRRPASTTRRPSATEGITKRMSAFEIQQDQIPRSTSVSPTTGSGFAKPASAAISTSQSERLRFGESKRPVSMYNMASSMSASRPSVGSPSVSLTPSTSNGLPVPSDRPRHVRKGSINDIVSQYEKMQSPVGPSSPAKEAKKPTIAAKPATLKKPTVDVSSQTSEKPAKPVKPAKPGLVRPTAVRHGDAPQALSWSKSSSGRSFPTTTPKPASLSKTNASVEPRQTSPKKDPLPVTTTNGKAESSDDRSKSSPDKPQSVNSLIARWNQGNVGEKKPPQRKEGYI